MTRAQITQGRADSPAGITLQLWRAVQIGDIPAAVVLYHEKVRRAIGVGNMAGALAQQRSSIAVLRPQIISIKRTRVGVEVTVRATSRGSSVGIQSFLLRRGFNGWSVAYDTLLGDALPSYVESVVQNRLAPGSKGPLPTAQLAAARTSATYRTLFLNRQVPTPKPQAVLPTQP